MNLYLLSRIDNGKGSWDITVAQVVVAEDEKDALEVGSFNWDLHRDEIEIKQLGIALPTIEKGVILDDYKKG